MTRLVLDCSVAMAWCFEDEADRRADAVLESLVTSEAIAPQIWPLEVANVLVVAERQKRLTKADTTRFVTLLQRLPITLDDETSRRALSDVLSLAREQHLSSYDAAYLELAMRHGCAICTLDDHLRKAALKLGLAVFES